MFIYFNLFPEEYFIAQRSAFIAQEQWRRFDFEISGDGDINL